MSEERFTVKTDFVVESDEGDDLPTYEMHSIERRVSLGGVIGAQAIMVEAAATRNKQQQAKLAKK